MKLTSIPFAALLLGTAALVTSAFLSTRSTSYAADARPPFDAVLDAQTPRAAKASRPEQQKKAHDVSEVFLAAKARPSSPAFKDQPDQGEMRGFDFARVH